MAEWLKAHAWKACIGETLSRVRIPLSPPSSKRKTKLHFQSVVTGVLRNFLAVYRPRHTIGASGERRRDIADHRTRVRVVQHIPRRNRQNQVVALAGGWRADDASQLATTWGSPNACGRNAFWRLPWTDRIRSSWKVAGSPAPIRGRVQNFAKSTARVEQSGSVHVAAGREIERGAGTKNHAPAKRNMASASGTPRTSICLRSALPTPSASASSSVLSQSRNGAIPLAARGL